MRLKPSYFTTYSTARIFSSSSQNPELVKIHEISQQDFKDIFLKARDKLLPKSRCSLVEKPMGICYKRSTEYITFRSHFCKRRLDLSPILLRKYREKLVRQVRQAWRVFLWKKAVTYSIFEWAKKNLWSYIIGTYYE